MTMLVLFIITFATMRTYGKYKSTQTSTVRKQNYATRTNNQWDIRITLNDDVKLQDIVDYVQPRKMGAIYIFISGEEFGKCQKGPGLFTDDISHCHIALITPQNISRNDALRFFRDHNRSGTSGEYCTPRNRKFTYAGWRAHHAKLETKKDPNHLIAFEYGTLPMDAITEKNVKEIRRMVAKFPGAKSTAYDMYMQNNIDEFLFAEKERKLLDQLEQLKEQRSENKERRVMSIEDVKIEPYDVDTIDNMSI